MGKRDDIIKAATELIAEKGVPGATIGNILKRASTGYGTLYNYFDSKEDLYLAVYLSAVVGADRYVQTSGVSEADSEQGFRSVVKGYASYCLKHQNEFAALEALRTMPDICQRAKGISDTELGFISLLDQCEQDGLLKTRPQGYNMNLLLGMVAAFVRYCRGVEVMCSDGSTAVTETALDDLAESCLKALS